MADRLLADLVKETSASTGTGTINLAGAVSGFRTFVAGIGTGKPCFYKIYHSTIVTEWEIGIGTVTDATPDTLSRGVLRSSNADALVNFSAGGLIAVVAFPEDYLDQAGVYLDHTNDFLGLGVTAPAQRLHISRGHIRFEALGAPGVLVTALAGAGAGNVDNGTHGYKVTYVTEAGETFTGSAVTVTVTDKTTNGQVSLTSIPVSANIAVTSRKIYRTKAGGGPFYLLTTIADNTTTTFNDNVADSSLTTLSPAYNTTAGDLFSGTTRRGNLVGSGPGSGNGLIMPVVDDGGQVFNVQAYGAVGNAKKPETGAMTAASATLTVTGGTFTAADVGKVCGVKGAGANQIANPTTAATVAVTGGGSTGGRLAAGNYFVKYTWVTPHGETTGGTSESTVFTVAAGNIPRVTIPSLPTNATGANIYLTAVGGASNTETLYVTGITTTTTDLVRVPSPERVTVPTVNTTALPLTSIIIGFTSASVVTLADAASTTVSNTWVLYGSDDTAAVQAAVDDCFAAGGGTVYFSSSNFMVSQIRLKKSCWITGASWTSIIYQRPGTTGHLVVLDDDTQVRVGVYNLTLDGTKAFQTAANDTINLDNGSVGDKLHRIINVFLENPKNNGITIGEDTRSTLINNVYISYPDNYGIQIATKDVWLFGIQVSNPGKHGFVVDASTAGSIQFFACKTFWTGRLTFAQGNGFNLSSPGHLLTNCYSQDCSNHGFYLTSTSRCVLSGCVSAASCGDAYRLDGATDCTLNGCYVSTIGGLTSFFHTAVVNLLNSAVRNIVNITFDTAAIATGAVYVQGTPTGNDVHVGPDGGYQAPTFPTTRTWTVVAGTDVITTNTAHGLADGAPVYLTNSGGALPASTPQVVINTVYYIRDLVGTTTYKLAATVGGAAIDFTGTGTGTHSVQLPLQPNPYNGNYHQLTLTADVGIENPIQKHQGQKLSFQLTEDATGARKVAFGSQFVIRNWPMNTSPNKVNTIDFINDGTNWVQQGGINEGFGAPGVLDRLLTSAAFNTSSAEQTIHTVSVPGDLLGATGGVRLTIGGDMLANSGAPTLTLRVKFGATTLWGDVSVAFAASAVRMAWRIELMLFNVNATNVQVLVGRVSANSVSTASIAGLGDIAAAARWEAPIYGTAAIDTTIANNLVVTAQWSVNNVAVEITRKLAILEFLG